MLLTTEPPAPARCYEPPREPRAVTLDRERTSDTWVPRWRFPPRTSSEARRESLEQVANLAERQVTALRSLLTTRRGQ